MENEKNDKRKGFYLILALLVALVIWTYVDEFGSDGNPRIRSREYNEIPIEYIHEDALLDHGLMLVEDGSDQTVDLRLKAPHRLLAEIDPDRIHVVVDLADVTAAGPQSIKPNISYSGYRLFNSQQRITITQGMLEEVTPFNAKVNIKELNSKSIEVRCQLRGTVADGYSAGQLTMSDTSIEIWGQAADIDPVSYAKVVLDIGVGAEKSISQSLPIRFYDENHQEVDSTGIRSAIQEVKVSMPVSVTKELRLSVRFKERPGARMKNVNWEIEPKSIMVSGDASKLNGVDSIVLTEFDLMELIDNGSASYTYPVTVPEACTNLSGVTRATMKISFKDMTSAKLSTNKFRYENLAEGKTVDILTEEMPVSIFGRNAEVSAVSGEQITVVADLEDYSAAAGTYTVPARIELGGTGDIGVSGTYEVRVMIRDEQEQGAEKEPGKSEESEKPEEAAPSEGNTETGEET